MSKKGKLINLFKALFVRVVIITHILVLYLCILHEDKFDLLTFITGFGLIVLIIEGFYTVLVRNGQEWKW